MPLFTMLPQRNQRVPPQPSRLAQGAGGDPGGRGMFRNLEAFENLTRRRAGDKRRFAVDQRRNPSRGKPGSDPIHSGGRVTAQVRHIAQKKITLRAGVHRQGLTRHRKGRQMRRNSCGERTHVWLLLIDETMQPGMARRLDTTHDDAVFDVHDVPDVRIRPVQCCAADEKIVTPDAL